MGTNFDYAGSASIRIPAPDFAQGTVGELVLAEATGPVFRSTLPHWPNEAPGQPSLYETRVPFVSIALANNVVLPNFVPRFAEALRLSATSGSSAQVIDLPQAELDALAARAGLPAWPTSLAGTPGVVPQAVSASPRSRRSAGQGFGLDKPSRDAIEKRAVKVAVDHYTNAGWTVTEYGAPFDLLCEQAGLPDLRVEVKGSTGTAGGIILTRNEVDEARLHQTDLFVVWNIVLDRTTNPPTADKGDGYLYQAWQPAAADLRVKSYDYQVPPQSTAIAIP